MQPPAQKKKGAIYIDWEIKMKKKTIIYHQFKGQNLRYSGLGGQNQGKSMASDIDICVNIEKFVTARSKERRTINCYVCVCRGIRDIYINIHGKT